MKLNFVDLTSTRAILNMPKFTQISQRNFIVCLVGPKIAYMNKQLIILKSNQELWQLAESLGLYFVVVDQLSRAVLCDPAQDISRATSRVVSASRTKRSDTSRRDVDEHTKPINLHQTMVNPSRLTVTEAVLNKRIQFEARVVSRDVNALKVRRMYFFCLVLWKLLSSLINRLFFVFMAERKMCIDAGLCAVFYHLVQNLHFWRHRRVYSSSKNGQKRSLFWQVLFHFPIVYRLCKSLKHLAA